MRDRYRRIGGIFIALIPFLFSCVEIEPCAGLWMTFFVDEQELISEPVWGGICADGAQCHAIPSFWQSCPRPNSETEFYCGDNGAWLCLGEGGYSYELFRAEQVAAAFDSGEFTMPEPGSGGCRARIHLNRKKVETVILTCVGQEEESTRGKDVIKDGGNGRD